LRKSTFEKLSFLVILIFILYRLWIIYTGRNPLDSDEAILGIMSLDILHGHFPVFFYGQDYMGSFQSLVSIPFIILFGATPLALRITAIAEGIGILLCWRWILKKWNLLNMWIIFGLLFTFAPEFFTSLVMKSRGGYIETIFLGSLWLVLLIAITISSQSFEEQDSRWFFLGLLTGIGWWTCQLIMFFFLPGIICFFIMRENRMRLKSFFYDSRKIKYHIVTFIILVFYLLSLILIISRGTISYQYHLSVILFRYRWLLFFLHIITILLLLIMHKVSRFPLLPLTTGIGIFIGYIPALYVFMTKEILYNAAAIKVFENFFINLSSLFLIAGGTLLGLLDDSFNSLNLPMSLLVIVPCIYLIAVVLLCIELIDKIRKEKRFPIGEGFFLLSLFLSIFIICIIQQVYSRAPRYAFFFVFFLTLTLAWFLTKQWNISRIATIAMLSVIIGVNFHSVLRIPPVSVTWCGMVIKEDQAIIDFLLAKNINAACTSFNDVNQGYWHAYRLTFSSGERLIVHPVLHMPRISRYREVLKKAERCAIITSNPESIRIVFEKHNLFYNEKNFGSLTVFWGFDKKLMDELNLISYRESI